MAREAEYMPSAAGVFESVVPSHVRVPGRLFPSPLNVLTAPLLPTTCTCQDFTRSLFPNSRPKSIVLWPCAALGEKPPASVSIMLCCADAGFAVWHPARTRTEAAATDRRNRIVFLMESS